MINIKREYKFVNEIKKNEIIAKKKKVQNQQDKLK